MMISSLQVYVQLRHHLKKWVIDPGVHTAVRCVGCFVSGFCLSAASLYHQPLPLAMGLICALTGWSAPLAAAGAAIGYRVFWGHYGEICTAWVLASLFISLPAGSSFAKKVPALLPALAALATAATGVLFQALSYSAPPVGIYLLQVLLSAGSTRLYTRTLAERNPLTDWLTWASAVLALAQIVPVSWLCLGFPVAASLMVVAPFPAAALGGLALDLAQVTPVPMTAVAILCCAVRLIPGQARAFRSIVPAGSFILVMVLCEKWDISPITGLLLGGIIGIFLPNTAPATHRRGETGAAQVRLEMTAGVFAQAGQLLVEYTPCPIDEQALVSRAAERACGGCPSRRICKDARRIGQLPGLILHKPLLSSDELPIICRKSGRFLAELHRSQEQLRSIRANRDKQREYRAAVVQQYQFLAAYLQELSDRLGRRSAAPAAVYKPVVQVYGNRPEADNGDRCLRFSGIGCKYYVLLCDGMGTGLGAAHEGKTAAGMLRKLLSAGYPTQYALRSLNSLCALRERSAIVTVDLAELSLDTGRVNLYKWGAAPSYLVSQLSAEKIGTVGPPPGLSVTDCREQVEKLSLRRSETLVLVSDGIAQETALRCCMEAAGLPPAELGIRLLADSRSSGDDDATAVIIQLLPA